MQWCIAVRSAVGFCAVLNGLVECCTVLRTDDHIDDHIDDLTDDGPFLGSEIRLDPLAPLEYRRF